jgi:mannose-6-phosphate isomerase
MFRLKNEIKNYAWGSRTWLAAFRGQPSPAAEPQAELWMGAHPAGSSSVVRGNDVCSLLSWIDAEPVVVLGERVHHRYGPRLPFLLKVLAAETPLSLQAHPSSSQASAGFDREDAAGTAPSAPTRNYKDRSAKPELLCAITPFDALCGFRPAEDTARLLHALAIPELAPYVDMLRGGSRDDRLRQAFSRLMTLGDAARRQLAESAAAAYQRLSNVSHEFENEINWARRIAELYPGDMGVVTALFLNLVRLQPGQAFYLPAGNLHAYLQGVGIEIMANSDNVLRGGLTEKHVDVPELLSVLDFTEGSVPMVKSRGVGVSERVFMTAAPEFQLSILSLTNSTVSMGSRFGPEILLCESGEAIIRSAESKLSLSRGESAFVTGSEGEYEIAGRGRVFRAVVQDA